MKDERSRIEEKIAALKKERDELALKIHLGKAEARQEWEALEKKLADLNARARPVTKAMGETAEGVGAGLELAAQEIKKGFDKIRKLL
jgi:citrate lyase beta subunit